MPGVSLLAGCAVAPRNLYAPYKQNFGMFVAHSEVNTFCLSPKLRFAIAAIEGRFGRKVVVNSGYRDPNHNSDVGGADNSYHMKCMAADIFIPGVSKQKLIAVAYREGWWVGSAAIRAASSSISTCATGPVAGASR